LKWAQTADKKIAHLSKERLFITNEFTNRLVHCWRSEEQAILIGTNTAEMDNPSLTNRLWSGKSPIRLVIDKYLTLPPTLQIFNQQQLTVVLNGKKNETKENLIYYVINTHNNLMDEIVSACCRLTIQSLLVEGGATLLQSFINKNLCDEARIITNNNLFVNEGLNAPQLLHATLQQEETIFTDTIQHFTHEENH
jgi:diaminohydroxyphosphoribosylaminopyrimidine deaminase/5-amino-6-(5-phosphoribosylamino)uracil reductase